VLRRIFAGETIPVPVPQSLLHVENESGAAADQESTLTVQRQEDSLADLRYEYQSPSETLSKGLKILESECFNLHEQGIRIALRMQQKNSGWRDICYYEIYPTESRKRQLYDNGSSRQSRFSLPPAQVKEMSRTDFRNNWKRLCDEYWNAQ
jgi:hypothetical protein